MSFVKLESQGWPNFYHSNRPSVGCRVFSPCFVWFLYCLLSDGPSLKIYRKIPSNPSTPKKTFSTWTLSNTRPFRKVTQRRVDPSSQLLDLFLRSKFWGKTWKLLLFYWLKLTDYNAGLDSLLCYFSSILSLVSFFWGFKNLRNNYLTLN